MKKIENVLFLCSGNTCRSVAAEYLAKWYKNYKFKDELRGVSFDSAGLFHYYETPQEGTLKYLKDKGINVNDFKAKRIDEDLIKKSDLILGFEEKWHIKKLKRRFKNQMDLNNLGNKLFLLLDFADEKENLEIMDPFDLPQEEYNQVLKRIEDGVIKTLVKIIEINKNRSN
jgi:protein-tyrosine-phosphatase